MFKFIHSITTQSNTKNRKLFWYASPTKFNDIHGTFNTNGMQYFTDFFCHFELFLSSCRFEFSSVSKWCLLLQIKRRHRDIKDFCKTTTFKVVPIEVFNSRIFFNNLIDFLLENMDVYHWLIHALTFSDKSDTTLVNSLNTFGLNSLWNLVH